MSSKTGFRNLGLALLLAATVALGFLGGRAAADQPHMRSALERLRAARGELAITERNKGGHRERALRFVDDAIGQVELGIQFVRNR